MRNINATNKTATHSLLYSIDCCDDIIIAHEFAYTFLLCIMGIKCIYTFYIAEQMDFEYMQMVGLFSVRFFALWW